MAHKQTSAIRQASKILDVTYIVPMEPAEARSVADGIKSKLVEVVEKLKEFHDRQGWKALGYASWDQCLQTEFRLSRQRAHQLLNYGQVKQNLAQLEANVSTIVDTLPAINEAQARELAKLPAEAQQEVWKASVVATNGKPTAAAVAAQVSAYRGSVRPAPKPVSGGRKASPREDVRVRCKALLDTCSDRLVREVYDLLQERLEGVS